MSLQSEEFTNINTSLKERPKNGLVLVWDLDQTIVGEYSDQRDINSPDLVLNDKAVALLKKAVEARNKDKVSAIFLLTNNADEVFIMVAILKLTELIFPKNVTFHISLFDYIMSRNHQFREAPKEDPPKSLREVRYMMEKNNLSTENLAERVFFIDDRATHQIANEIPKDHYIVVTPPFRKGSTDTTDYSVLEKALEEQTGGKRKCLLRRHLSKFRFKTKKGRRKKTNLKTRRHY